MAFTITGSLTVTDVRDGISAPTVLLTNENHTFVADADGIVADFDSFTTAVTVFVGDDSYTAVTGTPGADEFRIVSAVGTGGITTDITTAGVVTLVDNNAPAANSFQGGDTVNMATVTVTIQIAGITGNIARTISLSKAIGGTAPIIRVAANTQTVEYSFINDTRTRTRTGDIVFTATEINITDLGDIAWTASVDGGTFGSTLAAGSGVTLSGANNSVITFTVAAWDTALGNGTNLTLRATKGMASDRITVAALRDGSPAITVLVTPTSGSPILRSDTASVTLRADVQFAGVTQTPGSDWTYRWRKDNTILTAANIAAQTGNANTGFTDQGLAAASRSITVEGDGINDNTASLFSCEVVDPS